MAGVFERLTSKDVLELEGPERIVVVDAAEERIVVGGLRLGPRLGPLLVLALLGERGVLSAVGAGLGSPVGIEDGRLFRLVMRRRREVTSGRGIGREVGRVVEGEIIGRLRLRERSGLLGFEAREARRLHFGVPRGSGGEMGLILFFLLPVLGLILVEGLLPILRVVVVIRRVSRVGRVRERAGRCGRDGGGGMGVGCGCGGRWRRRWLRRRQGRKGCVGRARVRRRRWVRRRRLVRATSRGGQSWRAPDVIAVGLGYGRLGSGSAEGLWGLVGGVESGRRIPFRLLLAGVGGLPVEVVKVGAQAEGIRGDWGTRESRAEASVPSALAG